MADAGLTAIQARFLVPIGTILLYGGSVAPSGFLICDGSAVGRTTYRRLFATVGTTFGQGDGSTTFNLPTPTGWEPFGTTWIIRTGRDPTTSRPIMAQTLSAGRTSPLDPIPL